jgi:hypothetical protein
MKLFISYSHEDKGHRKDLDKHLAILKDKENLTVWSDVEILPGNDLADTIDENIKIAEVVCLLLSAGYFNSKACKEELGIAIERKKKEGIVVVPIILSHCGWKDTELSTIKALPNDGKEVVTYVNQDEAWFEVYEGIKKVIQENKKDKINPKIAGLLINETFRKELESTELSAVLGMQVGLSDIFISPDFNKIEFDEKETIINFNEIREAYVRKPKNIIFSGDYQAGKSSILKMFFLQLQEEFLPIYIDCTDGCHGKLSNIIENAYKSQYVCDIKIADIGLKRVILLDNMHKLKNKKRQEIFIEIKATADYMIIATADDIYDLGIKEYLQQNFLEHYKIKDFGYKLRDQLVCKHMELQKKDYENDTVYRDSLLEKINFIVDKTIVPAYPFFIYTIIGANTLNIGLDPEITSQGHCYQALIYISLRRIGVENVHIDMFINFLSEFANFLFKNKIKEAEEESFDNFLDEYYKQFTATLEKRDLIGKLLKACLMRKSLSGYSFSYPYIYYFFIGKYFSEHLDNMQNSIETAIDNLHEEENGYAIIFLIHHTKNIKILDHIKLNLLCLFDEQKETTLVETEVAHLEKYFEKLAPIFVDKFTDVEKNRAKVLAERDNTRNSRENTIDEDLSDVSMIRLRKAIKTVEVTGHILKNRFGSLKKEQQKEILDMAMNVYLRVTNFLLAELRINEADFIEQISYLITKKLVNEKNEKEKNNQTFKMPGKDKIRSMASKIFFEFNFMVCYATILRTAYALGSRELIVVFKEICEKKHTPLTMLIRRQALAMYKNSLNPKEIKSESANVSPLVKRLLGTVILNHFYMHKVPHDDRHKIAAILGISERNLLTRIAENKDKN